nr:WD repeat, SAM and U-box domain-containing protein 1-like isoform X1 [Leptinotarsa decemlineata]XP_023030382.1 WD repeat, SAM and U-box domain-containing protein 1-like isoform X1 [Leptinotarsa decemlineata]XP_023030383.1 WD repeat, SAM and U-box domain-containing protein 1-like isoform X1 [Leptinotarsa decemlineata]
MSIDGHNCRILQNLQKHSSDVTCCDFAPNFVLVTGSSDKTIRIWDWVPPSGYVERACSPLKVHKYQVTSVRVSPQGSMLASSSVDGTAILWNIHNCTKLYTMTQVNGDAIRVCRFSPDSAILVTAGDNGAICVWDLVHRSLIKTLFDHEGTTQSLAFTPDSQYLITACSLEVIRIWYVQDVIDTTTDTPCTPLARIDNAQDMGVLCVDISKHITFNENDPLIRQYRLASSGNTNEIKIWTITSKSTLKHKNSQSNEVNVELLDVYDGHTSSVTCLRYSNNGAYLVSTSLDRLVKIWDEGGNCVASLQAHSRYVNCAAISRDSSLVVSGSTGSNDRQVIIWDLTGKISTDTELSPFKVTVANAEAISESHLAQNNNNEDKIALLEKMDDISEGAINSCSFHGRDLLATGSGDKLIRLFRISGENNSIEELGYSPLEGHTYTINHVEFSKNGQMLASCSLDGCTIIWNATNGEKIRFLPNNVLSVKVCRFTPDDQMLVTAGDDEKIIVWNLNSLEKIVTLEAHMDSIPSACVTPDGALLVTVSLNADFKVWSVDSYKCLYCKEDAHDYGVQYCDISQNLEPIPNAVIDAQSYLLATCGNDSLVKLWRMSVPKHNGTLQLEDIDVKLWRSLQGHGGNVICVKFSHVVGEFICSTATDRQARIWSLYSADCLYVLDHDSIVTSCSFNADCSLLATGCLDKTLWLWKLPQQLVFQTVVAGKIHCRSKQTVDWSTADVVKWIKDIGMPEIVQRVQNSMLDGNKLLTFSEDQISTGLDLDEETSEKFIKELRWLKKGETKMETSNGLDIPFEFLCPITHEIMREPVRCSDEHAYERNAITEWFMSGKYTSPMTNEVLTDTNFVIDSDLRKAIHEFLDAGDGE